MTTKLRPDGWVCLYWRDNLEKDIPIILNPYPVVKDDRDVSILPIAQLEDVITLLRFGKALAATSGLSSVVKQHQELITRLEAGRVSHSFENETQENLCLTDETKKETPE